MQLCNFDRMVATIKNKNCKFLFNTTGQLMTEERSRHLVRYGVDRIIVSIDSLVPEVYERMHKGGSFTKLMRNLEALNRTKQDPRAPVLADNRRTVQSCASDTPQRRSGRH